MLAARRLRQLVELGLFALVAFLAALGVRQVVLARVDALPPAAAAPAARADAVGPLADYAVIAERDLFNAGPEPAAAGNRTPLRLWGIAFAGTEAVAVIEDEATRAQALYRVGDRIGDGRLAAIGWDRVTVAYPGGDAVLEITPAEAPAEPAAAEPAPAAPEPADGPRIRRTGENAYVVDRREIAGALDNPSALLTQLRAVAEVRDGRPAGFRLFRISDQSLFARLGLRDGDVVERVNGTAVHDPAALLRFLERLDREPRVALDIVRAEAPRTLVYDLR